MSSCKGPRRISAVLGAAVFLVLGAAGAAAEENRLTPPIVLNGIVGDGLRAYGQINKGFLVHDDGEKTKFYPLVDNANSSTRGGIWFRLPAADDFTFLSNVEAEWNPYSSARVNRFNDDYVDWSQWRLRKAEAIFEIDWLGRLFFGQGAAASDVSAERDLSRTDVIAYSSISDVAGGQRFVTKGGQVSDVSIGASFQNLDGLGRYVRVRYDTPEISGFRVKVSAGRNWVNEKDDAEWDMAATYDGDAGPFEIASAAAFSRVNGDTNRLSASSSFLHRPSGFSVTAAAAHQDDPGPRERYYGYAKLGWQSADLTFTGTTAFSADVYFGRDMAAKGSNSLSVGLAAVQNLPDYQTDLYAVVRWHDYEDPGESYENGRSFMTGVRFTF